MTKQEIEKAIENGESVWYSSSDKVVKIDLSKKNKYDIQECSIFDDNYKITALVINYTFHYLLKYLFKTQTEAEHYLHHANVERVEKLPFLTWEEFKIKKSLRFKRANDFIFCEMSIFKNQIYIVGHIEKFECFGEATEANFYKAYDECVRLFRGGE